ncbi:MAG TPA: hypothetical protein VE988_17620, partial [Gemmataceae bacterium]|nr:hypothetical protein [Gemmataceae bacterium]
RKDRIEGLTIYSRELAWRGLLEVAFMVCKLVAMQDTGLPAAFVVGLQRSSLLLAIIAGRVIFKEGDFKRRMLAGCLILAGVVWILWEQAHQGS